MGGFGGEVEHSSQQDAHSSEGGSSVTIRSSWAARSLRTAFWLVSLITRRPPSGTEVAFTFAVLGLLCYGMFAGLRSVFFRPSSMQMQGTCVHNLRQLSTAMLGYAREWDGSLPRAYAWCDDVSPYVHSDGPRPFACPEASHLECAYAAAVEVTWQKVDAFPMPLDTVMLYESDLGWNGYSSCPWAYVYRHNDGVNIGYLDGHVKWSRVKEPPRSLPTPGTPSPMPLGTRGSG